MVPVAGDDLFAGAGLDAVFLVADGLGEEVHGGEGHVWTGVETAGDVAREGGTVRADENRAGIVVALVEVIVEDPPYARMEGDDGVWGIGGDPPEEKLRVVEVRFEEWIGADAWVHPNGEESGSVALEVVGMRWRVVDWSDADAFVAASCHICEGGEHAANVVAEGTVAVDAGGWRANGHEGVAGPIEGRTEVLEAAEVENDSFDAAGVESSVQDARVGRWGDADEVRLVTEDGGAADD